MDSQDNSPQRSASSVPLEDYALLSDLHTGPLVSREGSIDWLCFPDFDSPAVFSAILGNPDDGRWRLSVTDGTVVRRRYRGGSFVLETYWESPTGKAVVVDLLPAGDREANVIRQVTCTEGEVQIEHDLRIRPDFGRSGAWTRKTELPEGGHGLVSVAGPEMLVLRGPLLSVREDANGGFHSHEVPHGGERSSRMGHTMQLSAESEDTATWSLAWTKSWKPIPEVADVESAIAETMDFWTSWSDRVQVDGERSAMVERSLLVLRALTHQSTGGIVAAPTASLPEDFGGSRNWDYRYTWLRDASLTIEALVEHGFTDGAKLWRDWLLRAVAGDPWRVQIMYGIDGRRDLPETELDHLAGYEDSRPVRVGNGAVDQYQADVVGEVMLALAALRDAGREEDQWSWNLQKHLLAFCAENFDRKDHGIWEMRGDAAYFTHGRVMMWAAFDEGLRAVEAAGPGSCVQASDEEIQQWQRLRKALNDEIHREGWNPELNSFVQTYGPGPGYQEVDASLLQLPHTGFVAADDPKMIGTTERIEKDLLDGHGFLHRYRTASGMDGLEGDEYPFLICLTWLGEQYANTGRLEDANAVLDRLDSCSSDLGLLAEEFSPEHNRLAGNFPQAFSHLGYVRLADAVLRNS